MKQGLSLEPNVASRPRPPPLHHSATVDCPPHSRTHHGVQHRARPPLRKSIRIDHSADTPSEEVFPNIPISPPIREIPLQRDYTQDYDEDEDYNDFSAFESQRCEQTAFSRIPYPNALDKTSLSATNRSRDVIVSETNRTNFITNDKVTYDKHSVFRSTRMRGTSSDRIIAKKRQDHKSVSSLGDRTTDSSGSGPTSIFEKRLGILYKFSKFEKPKRSSATTLYDDSPTEAFYNKTGSARLSSQELFEKFCSEDFVSLYGHENDNGDYTSTYYRHDYGHSKSLESEQTITQGKIYEDPTSPGTQDPIYKPKQMSLSHGSLGAIKKTKKLDSLHACKNFDYSTEIPFKSPETYEKRAHFTFDLPYPMPQITTSVEEHDVHSDESFDDKNQARSAPLLSPDKDGLQFNFDIAEVSRSEDLEESPSDATETRNLTLYEEPHSDRTSLSDIYESCFSSGIRSTRSSIKRDFIYKNQPVTDLVNLDFRPIDDDSPNTSKFVSVSSPDEYRSNLDTKSYYSDSVFASPEKMSSSKDESTKKTDTTTKRKMTSEEMLQISERSDSTTLEEEPTSIMDKIPEIYIERPDQNSTDYSITESKFDPTERTLSPLIEMAIESKSDSINLSESSLSVPEQTKLITSRPSMHKLEPFYPRKLSNDDDKNKQDNTDDKYEKITEHYDKVLDLPRSSTKREKSMFSKMKKVRDSSTTSIQRRTRCFPL